MTWSSFPEAIKKSGNPRFLKALVFASRIYLDQEFLWLSQFKVTPPQVLSCSPFFFGAQRLPKISKISTLSNYSNLLVPIFQFPHFNYPPEENESISPPSRHFWVDDLQNLSRWDMLDSFPAGHGELICGYSRPRKGNSCHSVPADCLQQLPARRHLWRSLAIMVRAK